MIRRGSRLRCKEDIILSTLRSWHLSWGTVFESRFGGLMKPGNIKLAARVFYFHIYHDAVAYQFFGLSLLPPIAINIIYVYNIRI